MLFAPSLLIASRLQRRHGSFWPWTLLAVDVLSRASTFADPTAHELDVETLPEKEEQDDGGESFQAFPWAGRCNIQQHPWPTRGRLLPTTTDEPYVVVVPAGHNDGLGRKLERGHLLDEMGDMQCSPTQAGSSRVGLYEMQLRSYIEDWMNRSLSRDPSENRYVFGEFTEQWAPLRDSYVMPPCKMCTKENVAITIGLGGLHSGAPWHFHNAGFVEVLHGSKHFALLPPDDPAIPIIDEAIRNISQFHWHLEERQRMESNGQLTAMQECTLHPGEILYFPPKWHHGVVNMDRHTAFVSSFLAFNV
eukprot:TRINITY_DN38195_c0_g1_i1.p1 TRINITY_DN38195_c0_g1~~TRINITY_DN38195_c0_g1_i1.p1  ORF type:complete len:305 (+),score=41.13 TRINITY_DN38195_c0_g1_i1:138-1052(+)